MTDDYPHIADATISEFMTRSVVSVRADTSIVALAALLRAHPFNGFPVIDGDGLLHGVVTRADLLKCHLAPYGRFMAALEDAWAESVAAIMTRHPISVHPFDPAMKAMYLVVDHRLRTIPVVEASMPGSRLVGVITRGDLMRATFD
jgi:CBS-domain-containing membrane protein